MIQPCVCTTARKASRALTRFYEEAMQGTGVTIVQFSILRALSRNGQTSLTSLADELVMDRTSLYRTLEPLEKDGMVTVVGAPKGRAKLAELSEDGRALMNEAAPKWEAAQSAMLAKIGAGKWEELGAFMLALPGMVESVNE